MKIRDLVSSIQSSYQKRMLSRRIRRCSTIIKKDLCAWVKDHKFPSRVITLNSPQNDRTKVTISIEELVNLYGMDVVSALLFMDDLIKANLKSDKADLRTLLLRIEHTGCEHNTILTPELLADIKKNQPGVWQAYINIQKQQEDDHLAEFGTTDSLNDDL